MLEIEAKIRVHDLDVVRHRLSECAARPIGLYIERNWILDRPDAALRSSGCGLRVRTMERLEGADAPATITFKGPVLKSSVKRREEIELDISDAEKMLALLTAIGFEVVVSYRKRRDRWTLDDCQIELDEVPLLGIFVEVEGPSEQAVERVRTRISLGDEPHVPAGYVRMLVDRCRELGRPPFEVDFEDD